MTKQLTAVAVLVAAVGIACLMVVEAQQSALTDLQRIEQAQALLAPLEGRVTSAGVTNLRNIRTRLNTLKGQLKTPAPVPVDCAVSDWSAWQPTGEWSTCTNSVQARTEQRTRTVTTQPSGGGAVCPALTESRIVTQACSVTPPPPPSTEITPNVWTLVTPTYTGVPNGGTLLPMTYTIVGAYDPVSKRTLHMDRWQDAVRGSSIYANALFAFDPVAKVVDVLKLGNWTVTHRATGGYSTDPLPANATDPTPVDRHPLGGMAIDPIGKAFYLVNGANATAPMLPGNIEAHPRDTWRFDLATKKWALVATPEMGPHPPYDVGNFSAMVYDPINKAILYFHADFPRGTHVWSLDPATNKWTLKPDHASAAEVYTASAGFTVDTKRNRVLVLGGGVNIGAADSNSLRAYSLADGSWTKLADAPIVTNASEFAYDSTHDVALALVGKTTLLYQPATNTWTTLPVVLERGRSLQRQNLTYNPAHDVFVFQGGSPDGPLWAVFRYSSGTTPPPPSDPDPTPDPTPHPTPVPSQGIARGCTSAWFIDEDCDGYGVAVRSSGVYGELGLGDKPDADDTDPALNTPASLLPRYDANSNGVLDASEFKTFLLQRKGLTVANVYYLSPTGNDSTGAANDVTKPFKTWHASQFGVEGKVQAGDVAVFRAGSYDYIDTTHASGEPGKPVIVMTAPGEKVVLGVNGLGVVSSDIIADGFQIDNPGAPGGHGLSMSLSVRATVRNVEVQRFAWPSGTSATDLTIEHLATHHQAQHGLYLASRALPSKNVTVRRSLFYKNGVEAQYGGLQHNGRAENLLLEDNILHSNGQWGLSLIMGVSNSTVRNNLMFNNQGHGMVFQVYPGHAEELCANPTDATICPFPQTNNLITNNTIWIGKYDLAGRLPIGGLPTDSACILVARNVGTEGDGKYDQGHNTFQNNICVTEHGPLFRYTSAEWFETTTVRNNVLFRRTGDSGVVSYGTQTFSFTQAVAKFPLMTGNVFADPLFVRANVDEWNTPQVFQLDLRTGSPAIGLGFAIGAPTQDLRGLPMTSPPNAGVYVVKR